MQFQQQQHQPSNSSTLPQSSSSTTTTSTGGSSDESKFKSICLSLFFNQIYLVLQQLLTSPNPPKQPSNVAQTAAQARLRTVCIEEK